jgi:tetratricopeptide (TPR) repeat protein/predicted Ser/Thr protein kinase
MTRAAADATSTGSSTGDDAWLRSVAAALGSSTQRASAWVQTGTLIDESYRIERAIGAGGMAVVYRAHDLELDRPVAIKVYDVDARELSLSRVYREARAMARLADPNVLVVHGVGVHAGRVFLAMEYVDGGTLQKWLGAQPRTQREIVGMFGQCARGLAAAHAVGVVHGDFKPENVLVGSDGRPRVADFGLARMIELEPGALHEGFAGTAKYAAPEQHAGAPADAKSDQFSFCVALQEALAGAAVPRWIRRVLARGLAPKPEDRFESMDAIVRALARDPSRRGTMIVAGLVLVGGAMAIAWPRNEVCAGVEDGIAAVWNEERAGAVEAAFSRSEAPDAAAATARVRARVDAWTTDWRAQRRDACLATHVRGDQSATLLDRRMLCLDRHSDRLAAFVGALTTAERETVVEIDDALASLPDPLACADTERLLAAVAPPEDPAVADAVARARARLAEGETALTLAQYRRAADIASEIEASAAATEYSPLAAEAALLAGQAASGSLEFRLADAALGRAYHLAIAAGSDDVARVAARELVCNASRDKAAVVRASWWADAAESLGMRAAASAAEGLELDMCRALASKAAGDYADAESRLRAVLVRAAEIDGADPLLPARVHGQLGRIAYTNARLDESVRELEISLAEVLLHRPTTSALAIDTRAEIGRALVHMGRPEEALARHTEELRAYTELYGPKSPRVVIAMQRVAFALEGLGRHPEAAEQLEAAIAIARERGDQGRTLTILLATLANNNSVRGNDEKAIELQRAALATGLEVHGPDHPEVGKQHLNLGALLGIANRTPEALVEHEHALRILAPISGELDFSIGRLHANMASMTYELGDHARYEEHLAKAEASVAAHPNFGLEASVLGLRSQALRDRGDLHGALALSKKVVAIARGKQAQLERKAMYELGADELAVGNHAAALAAFTESRDLSLKIGSTVRAAFTEFDMAKVAWTLGKLADARALAEHARTVLVAEEQIEAKDVAAWLATH